MTNPSSLAFPPGIYRDMPAEEYHAIKCASNSNLGKMKRSAAHAYASMHEAMARTEQMIAGDACHYAALQPKLFATRFLIPDQCAGMTGKSKRCGLGGVYKVEDYWYCGYHLPEGHTPETGFELLKQRHFDLAMRVSDAVHNHPMASKIMAERTDTELSVIWRDQEFDLLAKMRADIVCGFQETVVDLKTTTDASEDAFQKAIFRYGYYRQGPMYQRGLRDIKNVVFIPVEKTPPFAVAVYRLRDDVVSAGAEELQNLMRRWKECEESGVWPGYTGDKITEIGIPEWSWRDLEKTVERID